MADHGGPDPASAVLLEALEASVRERCRHLLTLVDRDSTSPTYGCFDRSYWQYRIKDFPTGMSQEGIYPLILALEDRLLPASAQGERELRQLLTAAVHDALARQHGNGSVDDYFPYEQAAGATVFSLIAILAALQPLAIPLASVAGPLQRRLHWLAHHQESGRLSNHEALIVLALLRASRLEGFSAWQGPARQRLSRLLSWRRSEGWFEEYGGFDVGYETLTFACLLEISRLLPEAVTDWASLLARSFEVILTAQEPDGVIGGELFARGTWNGFGHGLLAYALDDRPQDLPAVLAFLEARLLHHPVQVRDDYVIQHHLWSDLLLLRRLRAAAAGGQLPAARPCPPAADGPAEAGPAPAADGSRPVLLERALPQAGHLWIRHGRCQTHLSLAIGGGFRLYRDGVFVDQDTQVAVRLRGRRGRPGAVLLANAPGSVERWGWLDGRTLELEGRLHRARRQRLTTGKLVALRLLMLLGGRFCPDLVRWLMQQVLIHARPSPGAAYRRRITFHDDGLLVQDSCRLPRRQGGGARLEATACSTFRHVVMSRVHHPYGLLRQGPAREQAGGLALERQW